MSWRSESAGKRDLKWKWAGLDPLAVAAFSYPLANYSVCVYDSTASAPRSLARLDAPASAVCGDRLCWSGAGPSRSFKLRTPTGRLELKLRASATGTASVSLRARGDQLPPIEPASPVELLSVDPEVVVQIESEGGCWQARFPAPARRNTATRFEDRFP